MNIAQRILSNKGVTYGTKGIFGAVVFTTILRATSRPALIMADKKTDKESKKYAASKEFLFQALCFLLTFAMVIPTQHITFALSKKLMKGIKELEKIKNYKTFDAVNKDIDEFTPKAKGLLGIEKTEETGLKGDAREKFNLVKGAVELGSFVSSIVGLAIIAPLLGNVILHPTLKAVGLTKKEDNIGKPTEIFLADAKVPNEKTSRLNANA